jgi:hypothetical protein
MDGREIMKRIVTGVNEHGRSYVVSSDEMDGSSFQTIWEHDPNQLPTWISDIDSELAADWLGPEAGGGMRWLLVPFPPQAEGGEHRELPGIDEEGFHTTRTIDLDCLIEGELTLILDEERVVLHKGDCVVQQATRHAWRNESDRIAILVAVLHRPRGF